MEATPPADEDNGLQLLGFLLLFCFYFSFASLLVVSYPISLLSRPHIPETLLIYSIDFRSFGENHFRITFMLSDGNELQKEATGDELLQKSDVKIAKMESKETAEGGDSVC